MNASNSGTQAYFNGKCRFLKKKRSLYLIVGGKTRAKAGEHVIPILKMDPAKEQCNSTACCHKF